MNKNNYKNLIFDLIKSGPQTEDEVLILKRKFAKENKTSLVTNSDLLSLYRKMVKSKEVKENKNWENLLCKRQIRTLSGVAPIAVLTRPYPCPGKCIYCPSEKNMPKSYLSNEPAVMRAVLCNFDPFKQAALRILALENNGHNTDKIELIIMGGTWDALPKKYRLWFVYECFRATNEFCHSRISENPPAYSIPKIDGIPAGVYPVPRHGAGMTERNISWQDLFYEQKKNETAKHRIVGLTLETRPDYVTEKSAWAMREFGCTRVEIGVQHIDDKILKLNKRGATTFDTIRATKILRNFGFKITYHLMLNLPGSNIKKDYQMFKKIFSDENFQPDQIKIYPCVVNKYAKLYRLWKQSKYKPYTTYELKNLLIKIKKILPYYVRVIRVIRDIPEESIAAGNKITNLREFLDVKCKCIRCREVGHYDKLKIQKLVLSEAEGSKFKSKIKNLKLFIKKYKVSDGIEYFLSFESKDRRILYAFCRLRIPDRKSKIDNNKLLIIPPRGISQRETNYGLQIPIIRELHTYGQLVPVGAKIESANQHKGSGKKLLLEAEKIVRQNGFDKLAVIAGIGVREYYKKFGYKLKNTYMIKNL